jgi:hypothetical protein
MYANKLLTTDQIGALDETAPVAKTAAPDAPDAPVIDIERRLISGYCAVWDTPDDSKTRDRMQPGCFDQTLRELRILEKPLPLRLNHDKSQEIGSGRGGSTGTQSLRTTPPGSGRWRTTSRQAARLG